MAHWIKNDISKAYAAFRPSYPKEVFGYIASSTLFNQKGHAIDVGCGTGQATIPLAQIYQSVIGIDPSKTQIANADRKGFNNVDFQVGDATSFDKIGKHKADLITVFQAAHWFDIPAFANACRRAATSNSTVVGLVTYSTLETPENKELSASIAAMDRMLHKKGYWPVERKIHIDEKYATINATMADNGWELSESKTWPNTVPVTNGHLIAYLKTWSALDRYETKQKNEGGVDVVIEKYITSILRSQNAADTEEQLLQRPITMAFPVMAFFFKQKAATASKL